MFLDLMDDAGRPELAVSFRVLAGNAIGAEICPEFGAIIRSRFIGVSLAREINYCVHSIITYSLISKILK